MIDRSEIDWAHKRHEGMGGGTARLTKENGLAAHRICHGWMDRKASRLKTAREDSANLTNDGVVQWSEKQKQSRDNYKLTLSDTLRGA